MRSDQAFRGLAALVMPLALGQVGHNRILGHHGGGGIEDGTRGVP